MKILCIIPARGGSKGIPRKNVTLMAGKPLVAHSIMQAKAAPSITRVVVSTDSEEIATVSREWGAEVVYRPPEISGDTASSESALLHTLDWLLSAKSQEPRAKGQEQRAKSEGQGAKGEAQSADLQVSGFRPPPLPSDPDLVVFLQPTSPCRAPGEIQKAIDTLIREDADSLLSVGPVHGFVWRVEKDGATRSFSYDHLNRPRRQDSPEDLIENGSIYVFKPWVLRKFNNRLGGKIALHRMSALDSLQIDEPGDFELLEQLMEYRQKGKGEGQSARGEGQSGKREGQSAKGEGQGARGEGQGAKGEEQTGASSLPLAPLPLPLTPSLLALRNLKLLMLDFDGVLTDNRVLVSEDGREAVFCSREDGLGLERLRGKGIEVIVISKEKNPVVSARCQKLGVECIQGCDNKLAALQKRAEGGDLIPEAGVLGDPQVSSFKFHPSEIAYVGNDVNDLQCLRWVGLPIAVADAVPEVKSAARWITTKPGGHGAVREVCDLILEAKRQGPSA